MFDLAPYNTFRLNVKSADGAVITNVAELDHFHADNALILGHGSDVLFTDDFSGTVLVNQIKSLSVEKLENGKFLVKAGSGLILDELIESLIAQGIYGLENLSLIPGTVGAAPIQNVGAYGVEIGDLIKEVVVYDLQRHIQEVYSKEQCEFGYRDSYFKRNKARQLLITQVVFELSSTFNPKAEYSGLKGITFKTPQELRNKVIELRKCKLPDPKLVGNAGSFFKNPIVSKELASTLKQKYQDMPVYEFDETSMKLAAGWLIEKAGCKGITHGNVGTWEHQSLVIVNRGEAKPHEVVALAKYIMAEVFNKFGIKLEPEVRTYDSKGEVSWDRL